MKATRLLLTALVALIFTSCQKDVGENPAPPEEITTKMLKEYKYYDNGTLDYEGYVRYYIDSVANIVYQSYDTTSNFQDKFIYDASGRLTKIVYASSAANPSELDSLMITRPNANTVHFEYDGIDLTKTATTTNLAGGRKNIHITRASSSPFFSDLVTDLYMSASGKLDSSVRVEDHGLYTITLTRKITYNASGAPTLVTDIWDNSDADARSVYTNTITRDNNDNSFWELLISRMFGTDLGWMAYNFESGDHEDEFFNDYWMTDNLMMMKGSLTSYITNSKDYDKATGVMVQDFGSELSEYTTQYHPNGRLKYHKEVFEGEIQKEFTFKYYN